MNLKSIITVFLIACCFFVNAQSKPLLNEVDNFALKNFLGSDISVVGRTTKLEYGFYHTDGDYLSFIIPDKKIFFGKETTSVWYRFTGTKLTNLTLAFKNEDIVQIVVDMMVQFEDFKAKGISRTYYKGSKYIMFITTLSDSEKGLVICDAKIWPEWKQ